MSDNPNAIILLTPETAIQQAKAAYDIIKRLRNEVLVEGIDFGTIPGTDKPTLYKPGAEKCVRAFSYCPVFETVSKVEKWDDESPLFHYEIRCHLIRIEDGKEIATGIGSCNSKENRYRWRWVEESEIPPSFDNAKLKTKNSTRSELDFAIEKAETGGKYGKPAEYWNEWKKAIQGGLARPTTRKNKSGGDMKAWEMGGLVYRIPNDEVFTLVNTVEKMACKRAFVAATLIGTNASEFFTQDIEDLRDFGGDVEEGVFVEISAEPPPAPAQPAQPPPPTPATTVYWKPDTDAKRNDLIAAVGRESSAFTSKQRYDTVEKMRAEPDAFNGCMDMHDAVLTVIERLKSPEVTTTSH